MNLIQKVKKAYYTFTYGIQFPEKTSGNISYDAVCALYAKRNHQQKNITLKTQRSIGVITAVLQASGKREIPVEERIRNDTVETLLTEKFNLECTLEEENERSNKEKEHLRQRLRKIQAQYTGTELAQMVAYAFTYISSNAC